MRHLFILLLLALFTVAGNAQSQHWNLYVNKTKQISASVDSMQEFQLSKKEKGTIKFTFPDRSKEFKRDIIIMNEQRNEVLKKDMKTSCKKASFSIDSLLQETGGNAFSIYIRDIPADPQKAMLVRIAPVAICKVVWKE